MYIKQLQRDVMCVGLLQMNEKAKNKNKTCSKKFG